ncbi:MAG: RadC family protein [bacterium]
MKQFSNKRTQDPELPYEKCLREGPGALSDAQLLAVIIRTGTQGSDARALADKVLRLIPSKEGLLGLNHLTVAELTEIPGIGRVKAIQLQCISELSRRMAACRAVRQESFSQAETVAEYYMEKLRHEEREYLHLMMLDVKGHLLKEERLSSGTVREALLSTREIFCTALRNRAVSIILIHNHPSGDPTPSEEDILATRRVFRMGQELGVKLLDHVIIGDRCFFSLFEQGYIHLEAASYEPCGIHPEADPYEQCGVHPEADPYEQCGIHPEAETQENLMEGICPTRRTATASISAATP